MSGIAKHKQAPPYAQQSVAHWCCQPKFVLGCAKQRCNHLAPVFNPRACTKHRLTQTAYACLRLS